MANKDLFKQAIAEAKSIRESAIANAKEALEESLTPHLKDMLAAKLQEMEPAGDAIEEPADMDAGDLDVPGEDEAEPEMDGGDEEIDLDELIKELETVSEEEVNEAPKEDEVDEGMHDKKKDEGKKEDMDEEVKEEVEEEVVNEEVEPKEEKSELDQALETIGTLQKELNEVNLLNAKLLYVNKIFKSNDLNESQKVNIIAAFDKAETVKEVKLVYETVSENVVVKAKKETTIKESKLGMASKATGTTASKPEVINEVSDTVRRMQKLAGII